MKKRHGRIKATVTAVEFKKKHGNHGKIEIAPDIRESVTSFPWKLNSWSFDYDDALPSWQFCEGRPSRRTRRKRQRNIGGYVALPPKAVHAHAGDTTGDMVLPVGISGCPRARGGH